MGAKRVIFSLEKVSRVREMPHPLNDVTAAHGQPCVSRLCLNFMISHYNYYIMVLLGDVKLSLLRPPAMAARSIVICLSRYNVHLYWICTDHHFSHANGRITTKLAHDGLQVSVHPRCAQGQGQRSRDTGTCAGRKSLLLPGKLTHQDITFAI